MLAPGIHWSDDMAAADILDDILDLADELDTQAPELGAGDQVLVFLADRIDFTQLVPGPIGQVLERIDDPLAKLGVVSKLVKLLRKVRIKRRSDSGN